MRDRSAFFAACCIAATALSAFVAGCTSQESRAQAAYDDYEAASATGDPLATRQALLALVSIVDNNPTYWEELGRLQLQLKNNEGAYDAFTRAHELDSDNAAILGTLTQLALAGGNLEAAEEHAKKLELLAPGHPSARMTNAYLFLRRQEYDQADKQADALLETFPFEPNVKLLKARILLGRGESGRAIKLLQDQVKAQPDDRESWEALKMLHERQDDWRAVAIVANRLHELEPEDVEAAVGLVDALLRSNDFAGAKRASERLMAPDAPARQVDAVLQLWAERYKSPEAIAEARRLASAAGVQQSLAYATYFNAVGRPEDAAALVGDAPKLPLSRANLSINSVIATSLALRGQRIQAKRLFDAILEREPDHVYALRGRINLAIATGNARAAVVDAQRLVSVLPRSARDRLLLARAYGAAGDSRQMDRTLWNAFHEIEADLQAYEALRAHVARTEGADAARQVDEEFQRQRDTALEREFI